MKTRLTTPKNAPVAAREASICTAHDEQWVDHYAWLRADNWQEVLKDPTKLPAPIADYLKAENDYHEQAISQIAPLKDEIEAELRSRMPGRVESIPWPDGPYKYQNRIVENAEYPILVRTDPNGNLEETIFDVNKEAKEFNYFDFDGAAHSPDHSQLFWCCDTTGAEFYTLYFRDIATGLDKDYVIENIGDVVWGNDRTIFYTRVNSARRTLQVYKHVLDSDPDNDVLVFNEADENFGCSVFRSFSREYIFIQTSTWEQDEFWFIPVSDLDAPPTLIQARMKGLEYDVEGHQGDRFIISTNADGATDWKLVETPVNNPSMEYWAELVPYTAGQRIASVIVSQDWIVWVEVVNALGQIAYMDKQGVINRVKFTEEAYSIGIGQLEYQSQFFLFEYSSPTTPSQTNSFDLHTTKRELLKQQVIPSGHTPADYVTRRISVESYDSVKVPVTLLYRRGTKLDGTAPLFLYGYGSYGSASFADFSFARLSLVDRGFVFAIAHVRGGNEKGWGWHEAAKLERKTNSFHDFIAVGEALVAQRYCAPDKIVSYGASAGGLLVTASLNMKPELFAGVIADVADTDVLNLMLDDTLPGVIDHYLEWGNPTTSKVMFDAIRSYSPYENSKAMNYPALYVTAGISDTRVFHWQPAKWVANIRALNTNDNIILFKTDMQSGHFGKTGRYATLAGRASMYAFAIAVTTD